jgi:hypothetical protein
MKLGAGTVHGLAGLMAWVVLAGSGRFWPDLAGPGSRVGCIEAAYASK